MSFPQFLLSLFIHTIVSSIFIIFNIIGFLYSEILKFLNYKVTLDNTKHVVVITGCDTGFGELTSRRLSSLGFQVVSGCITQDGVDRLKGVVALSLICDVTKEGDITNLANQTKELLEKNNFKLWGIVNNAGIGDGGGIDWISTSTLRKVMEVNFFGVVMVTRALLPMLKKTKDSRIINLSSIAGFLSAPTMGFYDAAKHAVEGYGKALRAEMKLWNIHVSNINPGFMRTPIVTGGKQRSKIEFNASLLRDEYIEKVDDIADPLEKILEDPQLVVDGIVAALTDKYPAMWYFPGNQANYVFRHMTNLSSGFLDLLCYLTKSIGPSPKPEVINQYQQ